MRIKPEDTCCVIIDYQEKILPTMAEKEKLIANSVKLLTGLRILEIPMIMTAQYAKGLGENVPEITNAAGITEYCDKKTFSICDDSCAAEKLKNLGKKNVILCGIEAHICVQQSVSGLLEGGYAPILVEDCISSRDLHNKEIAVMRAVQEGAVVTTCESLLFELTGAAGTEQFKQISKLIK